MPVAIGAIHLGIPQTWPEALFRASRSGDYKAGASSVGLIWTQRLCRDPYVLVISYVALLYSSSALMLDPLQP